jgi:hypothetical protein
MLTTCPIDATARVQARPSFDGLIEDVNPLQERASGPRITAASSDRGVLLPSGNHRQEDGTRGDTRRRI